MEKCFDCPRQCGVDRSEKRGFCGEGDKIRVAKIIENFMWEEPCISGDKGTLAFFFSGCNLRCEFCQNYQISHIGKGELFTPEEFRNLLESFDQNKYSSIEFITPTHFSSLLIEALSNFKHTVPIVWNSGGYEDEKMLEKVGKFVDVFLPDFKFYDKDLSKKLANVENYFELTSKAIIKMRQLKPKNIFSGNVLIEGVLIRHLVLPGYIQDSKKILDFIADNIDKPFVSIMGQYTPIGSINRKLTPLEYKIVLSHASKRGLDEGYIQSLNSADENFIPEF